MKESIRTVAPFFNTHRMVQEYTTDLYRTLG
jgi:glucan phosphorylase